MTRTQVVLRLAAIAMLACGPATAAEPEGCAGFSWNVSHELALMKEKAQTQTLGTKAGPEAPVLQVDKLYELKLAPEGTVSYAIKPPKPPRDGNPQGGIARFHSGKAGIYRVSLGSGHWVDVVDGSQFITSRDFQGAHGCDRPHKIVEFELAAGKELLLQLSGSMTSPVLLAITRVTPAAPK
jgi:hypothetical protein